MKTKNIFIYLILITTIFSLPSCIKPVAVGDIEGVWVKNASLKNIKLDLLIPIDNPNSIGFKITGMDMDVLIDGKMLGKVKGVKEVAIPARSKQIHTFEVDVSFDNILTGVITIVRSLAKAEAKVQVKGMVKARALFINKKINVNEEKVVKLRHK